MKAGWLGQQSGRVFWYLYSYFQEDPTIPVIALYNQLPTQEQLNEGGSTESYYLRKKVMERPGKSSSKLLQMWNNDRYLRIYLLELCYLAVDLAFLPKEVLLPQQDDAERNRLVESTRSWIFASLFCNRERNTNRVRFFQTWITVRCCRHVDALPRTNSTWAKFQPEEISKACAGLIFLNRILVYAFGLAQPDPLECLDDLNFYLFSFDSDSAGLGRAVFDYLGRFKPLCLRTQNQLHVVPDRRELHVKYQGGQFKMTDLRDALKAALREARDIMDQITNSSWTSCHPFALKSVTSDIVTNDRSHDSMQLFNSPDSLRVQCECIQKSLEFWNLSELQLQTGSPQTLDSAKRLRKLYYKKLMPLVVFLLVLGGQSGNGRIRSFTQTRFNGRGAELEKQKSLFLLSDPELDDFLLINLLTASKMDKPSGGDGVYQGANSRLKDKDINAEQQMSVFLPDFAYLAIGVYAFATQMILFVEQSLFQPSAIDRDSFLQSSGSRKRPRNRLFFRWSSVKDYELADSIKDLFSDVDFSWWSSAPFSDSLFCSKIVAYSGQNWCLD